MSLFAKLRDALLQGPKNWRYRERHWCHDWVTVAVWNKKPWENDLHGLEWDGAYVELCRHCGLPQFGVRDYDDVYNGAPAHLFAIIDRDLEPIGPWVTRREILGKIP